MVTTKMSAFEGNPELGPGVYMIMGVNGVGKSAVADGIASRHEGAVAIHASYELQGLFGGISRLELESLSPKEKLGRMAVHFVQLFERHANDGAAVLLDTHLLVPIRKSGQLAYENIWSSDYEQYMNGTVMLRADPSCIRARRIQDQHQTGRVRDVSLDNIVVDQARNEAEYVLMTERGDIPGAATILENVDGMMSNTIDEVSRVFRGS